MSVNKAPADKSRSRSDGEKLSDRGIERDSMTGEGLLGIRCGIGSVN